MGRKYSHGRGYSYYSTYDTYEARVARGRKNAKSWQINSYLRIERSQDKPGFYIGYYMWGHNPDTNEWRREPDLTPIAHISPDNILTLLAHPDAHAVDHHTPWGSAQTYQRLGLDSSTDALVLGRHRIWHRAEWSRWTSYHRCRTEAHIYFHGIQFDMETKRCVSDTSTSDLVEVPEAMKSYRDMMREARKLFMVSHKIGAYDALQAQPAWGPGGLLTTLRDVENKPVEMYAALRSANPQEIGKWVKFTRTYKFVQNPDEAWAAFIRKWGYALRLEHGCYVRAETAGAPALPLAA